MYHISYQVVSYNPFCYNQQQTPHDIVPLLPNDSTYLNMTTHNARHDNILTERLPPPPIPQR